MSDSSAPDLSLLGPAIEAARTALRRLEADEVPASVRKIAAYSGGKLPPPLARRLVQELEDSWLRHKAADEFHGDDASASGLFLRRPEGWWAALARLGGEKADRGADAAREELERRIAELEGRMEETRRRGKEEKAAAEEGARELRRELDDLRKRERAVRLGERRETAALEADLADADRRASDAADDVERAERYAGRLREGLRRARRERAAAERVAEAARSGGAGRLAGLDLARRLDELAVTAQPLPASQLAPPPARPRTELPSGLRPDAAEAVEWLASSGAPALVLVDGYNVSFGLADRAFSSGASRERLNHELARLATRAPHLRVVAVYDSTLEGERGAANGPGGVEVVFASEERLADEEIVAMARAAEGAVAVISSDREVRDGAERAGAVALWGSALVAWIRKRS